MTIVKLTGLAAILTATVLFIAGGMGSPWGLTLSIAGSVTLLAALVASRPSPGRSLSPSRPLTFSPSAIESPETGDDKGTNPEVRANPPVPEALPQGAIGIDQAEGIARSPDGPHAERLAELARTNEALTRTVEELRSAKEVAEAASRSKSQFLANMSHEIRTPMNGVLGFLELLRNDRLSERQRTYVNMALTSGESLLQLINDILDFSKIEAGKLEISVADFELQKLVEEVVGFFGDQAHDKGIELACHIQPEVPAVIRGDSLRLRQILFNLMGNAVKFTPQGEVTARVSCLEKTDESVLLEFEIRDTGVGIPPEALSKIFQAFAQEDGSTARHYGGTGLGLTIARQLVQMMGGKIEVQSTPGEGSIFRFTARFDRQSPSYCEKIEPAPPPLRGLRVLVAAGTETNQTILRRQLDGWGMRNDSAENGHQALDMLLDAHAAGDAYGAAILDSAGPGMTGTELVRAIRADSHLDGLKLVMLTSASDPGEENTIPGVWAYLRKPVMQSQLYNLLVSLFSGTGTDLNRKPPSDGQMDRGCFPSLRILLVEDNPVNQELGRVILEYFGCRTDLAGNGIEALRAFAGNPYDLILMDCQMPEMDGYEATQAIRRQEAAGPKKRRTPIVALTAHAMEGDRDACLAAGMDDYLSKPFKREGLYDVLKRWAVPGGDREKGMREPPDAGLPSPDVPLASGGGEDKVRDHDQPPLDVKFLDAIGSLNPGGDDPLLEKVIRLFFNNSPALLSEIHNASVRGDKDAVRRAAHTLKSTSANLGARPLAELCRKLETQCRMDHPGDMDPLVMEIEGEYARVLRALEEELERRS
ncbi:MAG: response regulator [Deltaproteobacteria bacterium]|nr:response regulator [Deltaproteobacteria bacterium]